MFLSDVIRSNIFMTFLTANIDGMTIILLYMDFICHLMLLLANRIPHQLPASGFSLETSYNMNQQFLR